MLKKKKKKTNLPANARDAGDTGSIPGSGRSPGGGNGHPLLYSQLKNLADRGGWWAIALYKELDTTERLSRNAGLLEAVLSWDPGDLTPRAEVPPLHHNFLQTQMWPGVHSLSASPLRYLTSQSQPSLYEIHTCSAQALVPSFLLCP